MTTMKIPAPLCLSFVFACFTGLCQGAAIMNQNKPIPENQIRIASFNVGFGDETNKGDLGRKLNGGQDLQARKVAEIVQRVAPDILLINEIDGNDNEATLSVFTEQYLNKPQQTGLKAAIYQYSYMPFCNTGVATQFSHSDTNQGATEVNYGFGRYPGQYCMAVLSKYPIQHNNINTYGKFLWKDLPNAKKPMLNGQPFYDEQTWKGLRLSSKNHAVVPVQLKDSILDLIIAHPTPPVFDGEEDKNGLRNFEELRLIKALIEGPEVLASDFKLYSDQGNLAQKVSPPFVVMGDLNASSTGGNALVSDGVKAIEQLLLSEVVSPLAYEQNDNMIPSSAGALENTPDTPYAKFHTARWGMRVDYIIPSMQQVDVIDSGTFWPGKNDTLSYLVNPVTDSDVDSSDHRLVWLDVAIRP